MLSSRISAQDEEDVLAELAAMQAEQVRPALNDALSTPCPQHAQPSLSKACGIMRAHASCCAQTSTKLPEAPSHALPEVERPAASVDTEEEEEEGRKAEPARPARQLVAA